MTILGLKSISPVSLAAANHFEWIRPFSYAAPPRHGKKFRWPKPARPTTQPDGESRQVRRARERAEAKHRYGKDWRKFLAEQSQGGAI